MANNAITLKAQDRTEFGKGSARQARRAGQVPAVVYGHGTEPRHLLLEEHATRLALRSNDNALVELDIAGGETLLALAKDVQRHPIRPGVQHVDFLLVDRNERVDVEVPVTVIGEAAPGTIHMIEAATVMVSAPAVSVPEAIEVDVTGVAAGTVLTLGRAEDMTQGFAEALAALSDGSVGEALRLAGQGGLDRNLSVAEIVDQVRAAAAMMAAEGSRLSNIVFMGMGEPLANYKRVVEAVRQITQPSPDGFGISQRNVTVSTVGLAPQIRMLADEDLSCTLAVSLHTPDDELRDELVPVNNRFAVSEVLDAARYYADKTGRRVSIEYALIRDMNDQDFRADMLGKKLHQALGSRVHVNVIPLNPTPGSKWDASPKERQDEFVRRVAAQGVPCTVRDTKGQEIAAACGQLAAEEKTG